MLEKAQQLNELYDNHWSEMGCFEQSNLLAALREMHMKIDANNFSHYDTLLELDRLAMKMNVFIAPDGTIERVGPA